MTARGQAARATIRAARFVELDASTVYELMKLRSDVFVVEQACAYPDLDGRDTEPRTLHLWAETDGEIVACLRILDGPPARIGRVCTAVHARRQGLAAVLIAHALALCGRPVMLDAQAHLHAWYGTFGFEVCGEEFVEDGIPHLPMVISAEGPRAPSPSR